MCRFCFWQSIFCRMSSIFISCDISVARYHHQVHAKFRLYTEVPRYCIAACEDLNLQSLIQAVTQIANHWLTNAHPSILAFIQTVRRTHMSTRIVASTTLRAWHVLLEIITESVFIFYSFVIKRDQNGGRISLRYGNSTKIDVPWPLLTNVSWTIQPIIQIMHVRPLQKFWHVFQIDPLVILNYSYNTTAITPSNGIIKITGNCECCAFSVVFTYEHLWGQSWNRCIHSQSVAMNVRCSRTGLHIYYAYECRSILL